MIETKPGISKWFLAKPGRTGFVVFLLLAMGGGFISYQRYQLLRNKEQQAAYNVVESAKSRLQQTIYNSLSATQTLAFVVGRGTLPTNLDSISAEILSMHPHIDALQLVPDGVIRYIYPSQGNEAALNYNILADPSRNQEAYRAITEKKLYFAGPLELRQGGTGIVGRLPIFINGRFWGFSAVVIRLGTLLRAAGIDSAEKTGYYFQLSRKNTHTGKKEFFLPQHPVSANQMETTISIPDGEWNLSVTPVKPYWAMRGIVALIVVCSLISIMGCLLTMQAIRKPILLQQLVYERTAELDASEKRSKAIIDALPDLFFVINKDNRLDEYHNPDGYNIGVPREGVLHKRIDEIVPMGLAREIIAHKEKALASKEIVTHSFQLERDHVLRDFESRYVAYENGAVLLLVRDITESKKIEQQVKESEKKYRTLVEEATDSIFIADFKGNFLVVNPAATRISQYTEEELLKMTFHDFVLSEDVERMPFKFDELMAGKTATSERRMRCKDGHVIDVEITARTIAPDRFLAFARDISERKKVQEELLASREELRMLSNHLENIREEERMSIAREIHDELGQQLTVLKIDVARLEKKIPADETLRKESQLILGRINDIVNTVRKISAELRPSMLDELGLTAAIEWYSREFIRRSGIQTFFTTELSDIVLPDHIKTGMFRIFQESLTNTARHAEATSIDSTLYHHEKSLVLIIRDNGKGFKPGQLKTRTLGILGMKERAIMMKGTFNLVSAPGKGTRIEVVVPFS